MATKGDAELATYRWNGMECAYRQRGNSGKPVVLIHGFGVSSFQYREQLSALSETNRAQPHRLVDPSRQKRSFDDER